VVPVHFTGSSLEDFLRLAPSLRAYLSAVAERVFAVNQVIEFLDERGKFIVVLLGGDLSCEFSESCRAIPAPCIAVIRPPIGLCGLVSRLAAQSTSSAVLERVRGGLPGVLKWPLGNRYCQPPRLSRTACGFYLPGDVRAQDKVLQARGVSKYSV
jgi:hypothetical protein